MDCVPADKDAVVMVGATGAATTRESDCVAEAPEASWPLTVIGNVPAVDGTPEKAPDVASATPVGSEPETTLHDTARDCGSVAAR